jgi:hypothetical protein
MLRRVVLSEVAAVLMSAMIGGGTAHGQNALPRQAPPAIVPATATVFGLYPGSDFRLSTGTCGDCQTPKQALWYFRDELIAVPGPGVPAAEFLRGVAAQEDVKRWLDGLSQGEHAARPQLLWLGSPSLTRDASLAATGDGVRLSDGSSLPFRVVPKIATNLSYYDATSQAYFQNRPLRIRGDMHQGTFVGRTIWPQDWSIDGARMQLEPLGAGETLLGLVRRHESAKDERFETRLLWERASGRPRDWSGRSVLAVMLNGAQGDDDEAHGGHFAIATGRHANGEWADWTVNNFYNLESVSEKGITAAMLPMDNYLADLNSGQSWYRPSYMLVAILKTDRAPLAYQGAISRVYHHFYRHDFSYAHASANCTGISVDTLRTLGWSLPTLGPTSVVKAVAAYPYKSVADLSFASGKQAYDYLIEEQTRLYPAAAFEAAGSSLMAIASASAGSGTSDTRQLRLGGGRMNRLLLDDLEALIFVRIPQFPSSRAYGSYPVASIDEYMARVPGDRSKWKIVPVAPRPFPEDLLDADTLREWRTPAWLPALGAGAIAAGALAVLRLFGNRRRRKPAAESPTGV